MATIDEIELRAAAMDAAEADAMHVLGEAMRELAVNLPEGSRLAMAFAQMASDLDLFAGGPRPGVAGAFSMRTFVQQRLQERERDV